MADTFAQSALAMNVPGVVLVRRITDEHQWALFLRHVARAYATDPRLTVLTPEALDEPARIDALEASEQLNFVEDEEYEPCIWRGFDAPLASLQARAVHLREEMDRANQLYETAESIPMGVDLFPNKRMFAAMLGEMIKLDGSSGEPPRRWTVLRWQQELTHCERQIEALSALAPAARAVAEGMRVPAALEFWLGGCVRETLPLYGRHFKGFASTATDLPHCTSLFAELLHHLERFFPAHATLYSHRQQQLTLRLLQAAAAETGDVFYSQLRSGRSPAVSQLCVACAKPSSSTCTRCRLVRYCTAACQRAHWPAHKVHCSPPVSATSATSAPRSDPSLRFAVGQRVRCVLSAACGGNDAIPSLGHVIKHGYRHSDGRTYPYQVLLDTGKLIFARVDTDDAIVRALGGPSSLSHVQETTRAAEPPEPPPVSPEPPPVSPEEPPEPPVGTHAASVGSVQDSTKPQRAAPHKTATDELLPSKATDELRPYRQVWCHKGWLLDTYSAI